MDICKVEPLGATELHKATQTEDNPRPLLLPSEKNNSIPASRKPRNVASRYKSGISSTSVSTPSMPRRCPSPNASRTSPAPGASLPRRSQSAERRRPATPSSRFSVPSSPSRPSTPSSPSSRSTTPILDTMMEMQSTTRRLLSHRAPDGLWPSIRSLSSSFQSDYPVVPVSKREKLIVNSSLDKTIKSLGKVVPDRKRTPLRGRNTSDQSENSKPQENSNARVIDQHRWPGMLGRRLSTNALSRSVDLSDKFSRSSCLTVSSRGVSPKRTDPSFDSVTEVPHLSLSEVAEQLFDDGGGKVERDMKSVVNSSQTSVRSSSVTRLSSTQSLAIPGLCRPSSPSKVSSSSLSTARGMLTPSRTRPSTPITGPSSTQSSTIPGLYCPPSPSKVSLTSSSTARCMLSPSRTRPSTPITWSSCTQSSAIPRLHYPSSPSKVLSTSSSTARGMLSPSRTRPSTAIPSSSNATSRAGVISSVLNYGVDVRKGKKNASHIENAHQLRLKYNANLQWRLVNAQADKTLSIQKLRTENVLHGVWNSISKLRDSVIMKRLDVQYLQQEMKLGMILKEQMAYLEHWVALERKHCSSLSGTVEALNASTLRLPVTGRAKADVLGVKNAVSSAVDIMQAMGSSICRLLSKVEDTKSLFSELSAVAAKEKFMLDECRELLASTAAMQVQESSLRTHVIQLRQNARELD